MDKKTREIPNYRVQKYLNALLVMEEEIRSPRAFNMQNFMEANKLSSNLGTVLQKEKLILKIGENKRTPVYKWNTIKPNVHMTLKVMEAMRKYNATFKEPKVEVKQEPKVLKLEGGGFRSRTVARKVVATKSKIKQKEITPEIKLREVSLLWGLFKMNY
jgi:hypothetical protein